MISPRPSELLIRCSAVLALMSPVCGHAVEWSGLVDARAIATDSERSWTRAGLDKTRYDSTNGGLRLGQGILGAEAQWGEALTASAVLNASDDRRGLIDLQEAWLGWNPLPSGAWKMRAKAGLFFPTMNLEIDYDRLTWTPTRTISASAINSWIGEELRTQGLEFSLTHLGRANGSPHDFGVSAAIFNGNDPAGTLLAWRGWGIGDRISGVHESLQLADLPVYRADGAIARQTRALQPFREIDGRPGYYASVNYGHASGLEVSAMHYDNRANPLIVKDGQYSWTTRFNHLGIRLPSAGAWEFLLQGMAGSTMMGPRAVYIDYRAWYALVSHPLGSGRLALRYDAFRIDELDILPTDPNNEKGHAVALAYTHPLSVSVSLVTELLTVQSSRPARLLPGGAARVTEQSLTTSLRWQF